MVLPIIQFSKLDHCKLIGAQDFEAVQEDLALSPDSRVLADYEEYCRRELPQVFRAALEEIVQNESQPIEESIRNQLMNIIRDCQDRVFLRYRLTAETTPSMLSKVPASSRTSIIGSSPHQDATATAPALSFRPGTLPLFQPPTPQSHLESCFEVSETQNQMPKVPENIQLSDSGYSSKTPTVHSMSLSLALSSKDNPPLPNSQSYVEPELLPDLAQAALSTQNEDYNKTTATNTFEEPWSDFDPRFVELDEFIGFS